MSLNGASKLSRRSLLLAAGGIGVGALGAAAFFQRAKLAAPSRSNPISQLRAGLFEYPDVYDRVHSFPSNTFKRREAFNLDLRTGKLQTVSTDVAVHVIESNPQDLNLSALTSTRSDAIAFVDWRAQKQIALYQFSGSQRSYGHSLFSDDGRELIVSVYDSEYTRSGSFYIFEVPSMKLLDTIPIPRGAAHDLVSLGNGKYVFGVMSIEEKPAAFARYDHHARTFEYFDTEFSQPGKVFLLTHLKRVGNTIVGGLNEVSDIGKGDGALVTFDIATSRVHTEIGLGNLGLTTELLSLEFDPLSNYVWVTVPYSRRVVVWDWHEHREAKTIRLPGNPTFVSCLPEQKTVIVGNENDFFLFDAKTLERIEPKRSRWPKNFLAGRYCAHSRLV